MRFRKSMAHFLSLFFYYYFNNKPTSEKKKKKHYYSIWRANSPNFSSMKMLVWNVGSASKHSEFLPASLSPADDINVHFIHSPS